MDSIKSTQPDSIRLAELTDDVIDYCVMHAVPAAAAAIIIKNDKFERALKLLIAMWDKRGVQFVNHMLANLGQSNVLEELLLLAAEQHENMELIEFLHRRLACATYRRGVVMQ